MICVSTQRLCVYRFHIKHVAQAKFLHEHMCYADSNNMSDIWMYNGKKL